MISTKKTKLNVLQLRDLHLELNGDTALATKGLLQEKIPFVLKFHMSSVAKIALEVYSTTEDMRVELIKQYGVVSDTGYVNIEQTLIEIDETTGLEKQVENPNYIKFIKEWSDIVQVEKEIEHYPFSIEEFKDLETDFNYRTVFLIISP
jgi:hypothetical protein